MENQIYSDYEILISLISEIIIDYLATNGTITIDEEGVTNE
jgi:hypothetical protein